MSLWNVGYLRLMIFKKQRAQEEFLAFPLPERVEVEDLFQEGAVAIDKSSI